LGTNKQSIERDQSTRSKESTSRYEECIQPGEIEVVKCQSEGVGNGKWGGVTSPLKPIWSTETLFYEGEEKDEGRGSKEKDRKREEIIEIQTVAKSRKVRSAQGGGGVPTSRGSLSQAIIVEVRRIHNAENSSQKKGVLDGTQAGSWIGGSWRDGT